MAHHGAGGHDQPEEEKRFPRIVVDEGRRGQSRSMVALDGKGKNAVVDSQIDEMTCCN
jgi:hypothetical protein